MKKTNFDQYLEEQLNNPSFAARFDKAGEAWDVALQIAAARKKAGLSQTDLARQLKTSQQQISRLESPGYEGHTLATLRRVAEALHLEVSIRFKPAGNAPSLLADKKVSYRGILKRRPGEKPFTQKLLEERARDKAREERKFKSVRKSTQCSHS